MSKQAGLTLVDVLVVVAVFCGLAAVALPRFALLDEASRLDALRNLADEIRSTAELSHSIWVSAGRPAQLSRDDMALTMINGYPSIDDMRELVAHEALFAIDAEQYRYADRGHVIRDCYVMYRPPAHSLDGPDIQVVVTGC